MSRDHLRALYVDSEIPRESLVARIGKPSGFGRHAANDPIRVCRTCGKDVGSAPLRRLMCPACYKRTVYRKNPKVKERELARQRKVYDLRRLAGPVESPWPWPDEYQVRFSAHSDCCRCETKGGG